LNEDTDISKEIENLGFDFTLTLTETPELLDYKTMKNTLEVFILIRLSEIFSCIE
jgi:hypothetical protein